MSKVKSMKQEKVAILGAGVSGLSVARLLARRGVDVTVFESTDRIGGLARTFKWHGIECDIAPHRLYTQDREVLQQLPDLVPMNAHKRRSKIFMAGKVIRDPINPIELVLRFPLSVSAQLVWGYLFRPKLPEDSFRSLALNNFGQGLYEFFFKPYTKKMFGVPPSEISIEWGRQKLRTSGLRDALKRNTKVFFRSFYYPKKGGYGSISEAMYESVNGSVIFNAEVTGLLAKDGKIQAVHYEQDRKTRTFRCDRVISTIPATVLGKMFGYEFKLRFQPIQLVYLNVNKPQVMPYHWIYFGDGDVVINRMAEFKNFNSDNGPTHSSVLCAEVTVATNTPVEDVLQALERYQLLRRDEVLDTLVIPEKYGYPVYDKGYEQAKEASRRVFGQYRNLHLVGRNAEFRHIEVDEDFASALALVHKLYDQPSAKERSAAAEQLPTGELALSETP